MSTGSYHHPVATYRSTSVSVNGTSGTVDGELTLYGVTRPVRSEVAYLAADSTQHHDMT